MAYLLKEGIHPGEDERICVASYVIAATRVGGGPEDRSGFWPAYREALETNERTRYKNHRMVLCAPLIRELYRRYPQLESEPVYYRHGSLIHERVAAEVLDALGKPL